ncbi:MAG: 2-hydroxychromene-2-carboxylate isomerase, partial [Hyphomicrobiaceae bacterium]
MTTIDYYISLNSPWTYLGAQRFRDVVAKYSATVRVKPARFMQVFEKTGGLPLPKRAFERQAYRLVELKRWAEHTGLPLVIQPKNFPSDDTAATRLVIAAEQIGLDALRFSQELGRAVWELEQSLADIGVIDAAAQRAGVDVGQLRAGAAFDAALDAVWDKNTAEAIERGVFGAPSYVFADGEIMWG